MNDKIKLVNELTELNKTFKSLSETNTNLIATINKRIIKRDLENYLSKNNITFKINSPSAYLILDLIPFKEILISDFGFQIILDKIYINSSFNIELNDYSTFGDVFKIKNEPHSLSADYFIEKKIYTLDVQEISNLINEFKGHQNLLKDNIKYLQSHNNINEYSYKYSLYNKCFAPEVFFTNIDEIMEYIKNEIN